ncbi:MAG: helix-turn-helix domain-containing protein [Armatimonadota bacterium]
MGDEVIYESLAPEGAWDDPEFLLILAAERVSAQIAIAMDEQGVSQAELARRLGVSRQHISAFMTDPGNPTLQTIVRMAHALGLRVNVELTPAEEPEDEAPEAEEAAEKTPAEA